MNDAAPLNKTKKVQYITSGQQTKSLKIDRVKLRLSLFQILTVTSSCCINPRVVYLLPFYFVLYFT